jgi:hypothetical protein
MLTQEEKNEIQAELAKYEQKPVEARPWLEELTARYPNNLDFRILLMDAYFQLSVGYGGGLLGEDPLPER